MGDFSLKVAGSELVFQPSRNMWSLLQMSEVGKPLQNSKSGSREDTGMPAQGSARCQR